MKQNNRQQKFAVLVPAHNEARVIAESLKTILSIVSKKHIYVIDDGSKDKTAEVAFRYTDNVLVTKNNGKAGAINAGVMHFKLTKRYEYILLLDADTRITKTFIAEALGVFAKDKKKKIVSVVGKVIGTGQNWITSYRLWEYEVAQTIHKPAQHIENAVIVCSGCSSMYRASVFEKAKIPSGTLTEDMDFTFLIHRKKLGKIVYANSAVVVTQDPITFRDFIKQIDRWYTGFWQCLTKYHIPWGGQMLDVEVGVLATEGLFNGLLMVGLFVLVPLALMHDARLLLLPFGIDFAIFLLPTLLLAAKRHNLKKIFAYIPHFYAMRVISSIMFFNSFMKVILGVDLAMNWNRAKRYRIAK